MRRWKMLMAALGVSLLALASGCSYAGVAAPDEDTVVVTKNNAFLFGVFRQVYVCEVTETGLKNCKKGAKP